MESAGSDGEGGVDGYIKRANTDMCALSSRAGSRGEILSTPMRGVAFFQTLKLSREFAC